VVPLLRISTLPVIGWLSMWTWTSSWSTRTGPGRQFAFGEASPEGVLVAGELSGGGRASQEVLMDVLDVDPIRRQNGAAVGLSAGRLGGDGRHGECRSEEGQDQKQ